MTKQKPDSGLFGLLLSRTVVLPTGSTDTLTTALIECVINDHLYIFPPSLECIDQDSEKTGRYQITAPSTYSMESVDTGTALRAMKLHSKNHLAHRMLSYSQSRSGQQGREHCVIRSAEAFYKTDLVNPERTWHFFSGWRSFFP
jgi:hypothetical protein